MFKTYIIFIFIWIVNIGLECLKHRVELIKCIIKLMHISINSLPSTYVYIYLVGGDQGSHLIQQSNFSCFYNTVETCNDFNLFISNI